MDSASQLWAYSNNLIAVGIMVSLALLVIPALAMAVYWWWQERKELEEEEQSHAEDRRRAA